MVAERNVIGAAKHDLPRFGAASHVKAARQVHLATLVLVGLLSLAAIATGIVALVLNSKGNTLRARSIHRSRACAPLELSDATPRRAVLDVDQQLLAVGAPVSAPDLELALRRSGQAMQHGGLDLVQCGPARTPLHRTRTAQPSSCLPSALSRTRSLGSGEPAAATRI